MSKQALILTNLLDDKTKDSFDTKIIAKYGDRRSFVKGKQVMPVTLAEISEISANLEVGNFWVSQRGHTYTNPES